jgi:HEAT repeat protein
LARAGALRAEDLEIAAADEAPVVRARAADLSPGSGAPPGILIGLLEDRDPMVVEAACFGLGEAGTTAGSAAVEALSVVCREHGDPLCREAAVAALGAVGDPTGLAAILAATEDRPAVRRRAVLALAPFSGPEVDAALERGLRDRDWQVRQAAEDLTGRA